MASPRQSAHGDEKRHTVEPKANDDESMEIAWVPIEQVGGLKLLTAMRTDWPRFAARLNALAATYR